MIDLMGTLMGSGNGMFDYLTSTPTLTAPPQPSDRLAEIPDLPQIPPHEIPRLAASKVPLPQRPASYKDLLQRFGPAGLKAKLAELAKSRVGTK